MVSGAEILTAMAAILGQACPEVPTLLIDRGNWGRDWASQIRRWPVLLLRHLGSKSQEGPKIGGEQQLVQVILGERNLRLSQVESEGFAALRQQIRQALENQDLGLTITPLTLVSDGPVAMGAEYRGWGQIYQTIAYWVRTVVLAWQNDSGQEEEVRLPLYYSPNTGEQLQEGTEWGRALDGSLHGYLGPRKRRFTLELPRLTEAQKTALVRVKAVPGPVSFYLAERPEEVALVVWTGEVTWREERPGIWSTRVVLQEA